MLQVLSCASFTSLLLGAMGFVGLILFRGRSWSDYSYRLALLGGLFYTLWLGYDFYLLGYPYIHSDQESFRFAGWLLLLLFLAFGRQRRWRFAGALMLPLSMALALLSLKAGQQYGSLLLGLSNPWLLVHLFFAILAFVIFLVSFVVGILFILVEQRLKRKQIDGWVIALPSVDQLDRIHYKALGVGLIFLTVAILVGFYLNLLAYQRIFMWDHRQIAILVAWMLYSLLLGLHVQAGWRGRKGIVISLLGFIGVVMVFLGLPHGMGVM